MPPKSSDMFLIGALAVGASAAFLLSYLDSERRKVKQIIPDTPAKSAVAPVAAHGEVTSPFGVEITTSAIDLADRHFACGEQEDVRRFQIAYSHRTGTLLPCDGKYGAKTASALQATLDRLAYAGLISPKKAPLSPYGGRALPMEYR